MYYKALPYANTIVNKIQAVGYANTHLQKNIIATYFFNFFNWLD